MLTKIRDAPGNIYVFPGTPQQLRCGLGSGNTMCPQIQKRCVLPHQLPLTVDVSKCVEHMDAVRWWNMSYAWQLVDVSMVALAHVKRAETRRLSTVTTKEI